MFLQRSFLNLSDRAVFIWCVTSIKLWSSRVICFSSTLDDVSSQLGGTLGWISAEGERLTDRSFSMLNLHGKESVERELSFFERVFHEGGKIQWLLLVYIQSDREVLDNRYYWYKKGPSAVVYLEIWSIAWIAVEGQWVDAEETGSILRMDTMENVRGHVSMNRVETSSFQRSLIQTHRDCIHQPAIERQLYRLYVKEDASVESSRSWIVDSEQAPMIMIIFRSDWWFFHDCEPSPRPATLKFLYEDTCHWLQLMGRNSETMQVCFLISFAWRESGEIFWHCYFLSTVLRRMCV